MRKPSPDKKIPCPKCSGPMTPRARHGCRNCSWGGAPQKSATVYARKLGISKRTLQRLGGEERLRSLSPEIRAIVLKPHIYGNSQQVSRGGLKARGMRRQTRGIDTQPYAPLTTGEQGRQ